MRIVLDTNVLVSALWRADSKPGMIVMGMIAGRFTPCYDYRIISEYEEVLRRPKFGFDAWEIRSLMDAIVGSGFSVVPKPLQEIPFTDDSDRKFLETAVFCRAHLITGNLRHYPDVDCAISVSDFCDRFF